MVEDNSTLERIAKRLSRGLNTTGSKSALDRWKHRLARRYEFSEIISRLEFSGALSLDEYMPRRGGRYGQIAGDAIKKRILYIEAVHEFYGRGVTEAFCRRLEERLLIPEMIEIYAGTVVEKILLFKEQLQKIRLRLMQSEMR